MAKMHQTCPNCSLLYEKEPSFFYGSMYISYAIQVALFVTVFIGTKVLYPEAGLLWYILATVGITILLAPLIFRLSRSAWIHMFVKYDAEKAAAQK